MYEGCRLYHNTCNQLLGEFKTAKHLGFNEMDDRYKELQAHWKELLDQTADRGNRLEEAKEQQVLQPLSLSLTQLAKGLQPACRRQCAVVPREGVCTDIRRPWQGWSFPKSTLLTGHQDLVGARHLLKKHELFEADFKAQQRQVSTLHGYSFLTLHRSTKSTSSRIHSQARDTSVPKAS